MYCTCKCLFNDSKRAVPFEIVVTIGCVPPPAVIWNTQQSHRDTYHYLLHAHTDSCYSCYWLMQILFLLHFFAAVDSVSFI